MKKIILLSVIFIAVICNAQRPKSVNVIPMPAHVDVSDGSFSVKGASVRIDPSIKGQSRQAIDRFVAAIGKATAKKLKKGKGGFEFALNPSLDKEEYSIRIDDNGARVEASALNGFVYACETLKQMLPVSVYGGRSDCSSDWALPYVTIKDSPRFGYRGAMLDAARHFWSIEETKRFIDVMSIYKLNRFHWHLTDDQGWRVEIKSYPNLTKVGAWRGGTQTGKDRTSNDGVRYGGYYTQAQLKEIVSYAADRGITVIPEIELPGHMVATLASYPEFGCTGGPYEVRRQWGIALDILCAGSEEVFAFLDKVFEELTDIFPSEYVHIGGDECFGGRKYNGEIPWDHCPRCAARMAQLGIEPGPKARHLLQNYVTARVQRMLNDKGRRIIGWGEILQGEVVPGTTIMSWRDTKAGIEAVSKGLDAIMSPKQYCYFDYYQSRDNNAEPLAIGGYLPLETVYSYEPMEGMPEGADEHVLGVQCNLWTEYIGTEDYLEYMLLPRLCAVSEVQWCKPEVKDYLRFSKSLRHTFSILDAKSINYRKEPWVLTWMDDFNGFALDTASWSRTRRGKRAWNDNMSLREDLLDIKDGQLILHGKVNDDFQSDTSRIITSGITSAGKRYFSQARFEVRAKFNCAMGFWPAIWLRPRYGKDTIRDYAEIDLMEHLNFKKHIYQTIHSGYSFAGNDKIPPHKKKVNINPEDWNEYAAEVHPDSICFFVNGIKTFTYPRIVNDVAPDHNQFPFSDLQFHVILSNQLGGKWVGPIREEDLPSELRIDWVKVYLNELSPDYQPDF